MDLSKLSIRNSTVLLGIVIASAQAFTLGHLKALGVEERPSYFLSLSFVFELLLSKSLKFYDSLGISVLFLEIAFLLAGIVGFWFLFKAKGIYFVQKAIFYFSLVVGFVCVLMAWDIFAFFWVISFPAMVAVAVYNTLKASILGVLSPRSMYVSKAIISVVLLAFSWTYPYGYAKKYALNHTDLLLPEKGASDSWTEPVLIWRSENHSYWYECRYSEVRILHGYSESNPLTTSRAPDSAFKKFCLQRNQGRLWNL